MSYYRVYDENITTKEDEKYISLVSLVMLYPLSFQLSSFVPSHPIPSRQGGLNLEDDSLIKRYIRRLNSEE